MKMLPLVRKAIHMVPCFALSSPLVATLNVVPSYHGFGAALLSLSLDNHPAHQPHIRLADGRQWRRRFKAFQASR